MQINRTILAILCGAALFASACSSSTSPTTVSSLTATGAVPALGAASQFTATAALADGTTQYVTAQSTWTTSNSGVAPVSVAGVVSGIAAGLVTVSAPNQSLSATYAIL